VRCKDLQFDLSSRRGCVRDCAGIS
jgi:hypothetical protein